MNYKRKVVVHRVNKYLVITWPNRRPCGACGKQRYKVDKVKIDNDAVLHDSLVYVCRSCATKRGLIDYGDRSSMLIFATYNYNDDGWIDTYKE